MSVTGGVTFAKIALGLGDAAAKHRVSAPHAKPFPQQVGCKLGRRSGKIRFIQQHKDLLYGLYYFITSEKILQGK
jgi:hypothetical protein